MGVEAFPQILFAIQFFFFAVGLVALFSVAVYAVVYFRSRVYKNAKADEIRRELRQMMQNSLLVVLGCILVIILLPLSGPIMRLLLTGSL